MIWLERLRRSHTVMMSQDYRGTFLHKGVEEDPA